MEKLKKGNFTDEEFEIAKGICITAKNMELQTNSELAMDVCLNELYGLGFDFQDRYSYNINKVTRDDVVSIANKYLTNYLLTISLSGESTR